MVSSTIWPISVAAFTIRSNFSFIPSENPSVRNLPAFLTRFFIDSPTALKSNFEIFSNKLWNLSQRPSLSSDTAVTSFNATFLTPEIALSTAGDVSIQSANFTNRSPIVPTTSAINPNRLLTAVANRSVASTFDDVLSNNLRNTPITASPILFNPSNNLNKTLFDLLLSSTFSFSLPNQFITALIASLMYLNAVGIAVPRPTIIAFKIVECCIQSAMAVNTSPINFITKHIASANPLVSVFVPVNTSKKRANTPITAFTIENTPTNPSLSL